MRTFNYSLMSVKTADAARIAAKRINMHLRNATKDIVEIGRDLAEQKECLGHGYFLDWIAAEFNMSERTARNFMSVFREFGETAKIADLRPSVLYALSAASTPPGIREQAIGRAVAGETVTLTDVKAMKAEWAAGRKQSTAKSKGQRHRNRRAEAEQMKLPKIASGDPISALDRCAMHLRNLVLDSAGMISPDEWPSLLAKLRDELDDIEEVLKNKGASYELCQ